MSLGTRDQLRRKVLRLLGAEADDPALTDGGEADNEVVDEGLEHGMWNGQRYLIDVGCGDEWHQTATLSFGAEDATGARSATLPDDFLRLSGAGAHSSLLSGDGQPWGQVLKDRKARRYVRGDYYWLSNGLIWVPRGASLPSTVKLDYFERLALPAEDDDDDEVDLPEDARPLIPAEAAYYLMHENWITANDGPAFENRIARNRASARTDAVSAMRRTDGLQQSMEEPDYVSSHHFL